MKSYKLVNSREVQEKAEQLGYKEGINRYNPSEPFFFTHFDYTYQSYDKYVGDSFQEITQADFLALPEPIKVGDWVKWDNNVHKPVIFNILMINQENEAFWEKDYDRYFNLDFCTKLTEKQVKILGLEE